MDQVDLFIRFGVAIGIGFVIGLQREFAQRGQGEIVAGERTLALMGLSGCLAAMAADALGSPVVFVGVILLLGIFTAISYFIDAWRGYVGLTTEVAILVVILSGALCYWGYLTLAVAIGIVTTVLLSLKVETDCFVRTLTQEDIMTALKFAVITAIVLPVLPNQSFWEPPFDVLNPFKIWLMVVFISAINFLGYVLIKLIGAQQVIGLTGLLGGLVSSTAVTLSFSERSKRETGLARVFALGITLAWTVMFLKVLVEVGVLNPRLLSVLWIPLAAAGGVGVAYCLFLFLSQRVSEKGEVTLSNPFDLGSAIKFGLLYGVILLASRVAQTYFGDTGVLVSSIVSGLADVDAITLSMAELSSISGGIDLVTAERAIVLAAMANTVVKGGIVLTVGGRQLRRALLPALVLMLIAGVSVAFLI
ncbi:MAG: MgtC/SapB family protein [Chloroflexota bacterium]